MINYIETYYGIFPENSLCAFNVDRVVLDSFVISRMKIYSDEDDTFDKIAIKNNFVNIGKHEDLYVDPDKVSFVLQNYGSTKVYFGGNYLFTSLSFKEVESLLPNLANIKVGKGDGFYMLVKKGTPFLLCGDDECEFLDYNLRGNGLLETKESLIRKLS